jgi:hypothetical protein
MHQSKRDGWEEDGPLQDISLSHISLYIEAYQWTLLGALVHFIFRPAFAQKVGGHSMVWLAKGNSLLLDDLGKHTALGGCVVDEALDLLNFLGLYTVDYCRLAIQQFLIQRLV